MNRSLSRRSLLLLLVFLAGLSIVIYVLSRPRPVPGQHPLTDIQSIGTLQTQFNRDAGKTRLILIASPTGITCLAGARWVQNQLTHIPSQDLSVYTIWIPVLGSDSRDDWNGNTMADPRVLHFWDGEYLAGQWFARKVDGYDAIAWDVYYLYGPDATWDTVPSPLIGSGGTIYDFRQQLQSQLMRLMERGSL